MKLTPHVYTSTREKRIDLIIGFVGFHVVNGIMALISFGAQALAALYTSPGSMESVTNLLLLPTLLCPVGSLVVNIGGLILLALTRSRIALGILAAWAFWALLTLLALVVTLAICFGVITSSTIR